MTRKTWIAALGGALLLGLPGAIPAAGATVWVAKDGADTAEGTELHPFASLERAREAVRAAVRKGESGEVVIRGGTYELGAPLTLEAQDSGTVAAPVIWHAYQGEEVHLSSGRQVKAWHPVSDPVVLAQLDPAVRGSVWVTDLKAQGIVHYGEMSGGFGHAGSTGLELLVDDQPMNLSRYPRQGYLTLVEVLGPTPSEGTRPEERQGRKEGIFRVTDPHVARWVNEKDPQVLGYWYWDWADQRQKMVSIDPATLTITLAPPWHSYGYRKGQYFYAYNLLCEMNQPGDWYLDRAAGLLYLFPPAGKTEFRSTVSMLPSVVILNGANHVEFRDLIFEDARSHALVMTNCEGSGVSGATFRNCGGWAVRIEGGHDCWVRRCAAFNLGDGGVSLSGGDRISLAPGRHEVVNCDIHDYSQWDRTYQPGIRLAGVGCRAAHNLIHDAPHQGIAFQGNDQVIEYNDIHDVCKESNDVGAIYAWNDWAGRGNRIAYNYIHDVMGYQDKGANGVYLDDDFSSATILGNVFRRVERAIHLGGGRDHRVQNNLFAECSNALHIDARGLGWRANGFEELKQKLQLWPYQTPPWSDRYPELVHILDEEPMAPRGIVVSNNILVSCAGDDIEKKAKGYVTLKRNLMDAPVSILVNSPKDIPQVDPADARVQAIDFQPIPYHQIGLEKDGAN